MTSLSQGPWTAEDEDLLVSNLEIGQPLEILANVLGRSEFALAMKMVRMYCEGQLVVLHPDSLDNLLKSTKA